MLSRHPVILNGLSDRLREAVHYRREAARYARQRRRLTWAIYMLGGVLAVYAFWMLDDVAVGDQHGS